MPDIDLDADGLRRDRQRYFGLLEQAEQQIAAWNERADHLQQAIDGLDRLLALAGDDPAQDGGTPRGPVLGRGVAPLAATEAAPAAPPAADPPARRPAGEKAPKKASGRAAAKKPPPPATPAAPEPVEPPAAAPAETPRGTDALRLVFESEAGRTWSLGELIDALGAKGWLPTSRRPEEGVRISLKRLAERGRVVRTDDGEWRLTGSAEAEAPEATEPPESAETLWPESDAPPTPADPAPEAVPPVGEPGPPAVASRPNPSPPPPASFGRPVGGTITEL